MELFRRLRAPSVDSDVSLSDAEGSDAEEAGLWAGGPEDHPYRRLSRALEGVAVLERLEEATGGVPKPYLAVGLVVAAIALCVQLFGAAVFCSAVLIAFPASMTLKTLDGGFPLHTDRAHWLRYWVVHGAVHVAEAPFASALAAADQYHLIKLVLLLWCASPGDLGGGAVAYGAVRPLLKRHEESLDAVFGAVGERWREVTVDVGTSALPVIFGAARVRLAALLAAPQTTPEGEKAK